MNCLSPSNLSRRFWNVFQVGAVTTCPGNAFHGEITLDEKNFLRISFLQDFFFQQSYLYVLCLIDLLIASSDISRFFQMIQSKVHNNRFANNIVNSSQVKNRYIFSQSFHSECFSKDGNYAESQH